ncbi:MAG: c-type cytochrome [Ignavibacteria bacterium]|nr:c-type cytochrome [Ignavibacteria bacterium]MBI3766448.1 c-type cytochrome [Ignavibacteriales bacterium]
MKTVLWMFIIFISFVIDGLAQDKKLDGKPIFIAKKCGTCHSIAAVGIIKKTTSTAKSGPPDLSMVGTRHDSTFIVKWLQKAETINGKKHLLKFAGSNEELGVLAQWLVSLKSDSLKSQRKP